MEHESIVWPKSADDIIRYSALVYQKGLVSAAGGNVSARLGGDMLITGSNVPLRAAGNKPYRPNSVAERAQQRSKYAWVDRSG